MNHKLHKGRFWIGTSNAVVPGSKHSFPAEYQNKSRLTYYASLFNTVELNSTFKKLPRLSTFEKWQSEVPKDFQFSVKLSKEITHVKPFAVNATSVETFMHAANRLGDKKGCLLTQFPASITVEYATEVEQILQTLHELNPANEWKKAVEFRSVTWYTDANFEMLNKYNASMVFHDMPASINLSVNTNFPFFYFRFHGPTGNYRGSYTDDFLYPQAEKMRSILRTGRDVFVYFNNTMGSAFDNAVTLQKMIET